MPKTRPQAYNTLHRVADSMEAPFTRLLLQVFREAREQAGADLEERLKVRRGPNVDWRAVTVSLLVNMEAVLLDLVNKAGAALESELPTTLEKRLDRTGSTIVFRFDLTNPHSIQWARVHAGDLVTGITSESRLAIRAIVDQAFREGIPVRRTAQAIRASIGLTRQQATALLNYQEFLSATSQPAPGSRARGRSQAQVDRLVQRYQDRLIRHRAKVIARTETMTAANQGQQLLWQQAREDGVLDPRARQRWIITPDERLCEICAPIPSNTQNHAVPFGAPFTDGNGTQLLAPPAHPQCRCTLALVFPDDETGAYPGPPSETPAFAGADAPPRRPSLKPAS